MVCEGSIIRGARLRESLLGYDCSIDTNAHLDESMLMSGCKVGAGARLQRVLADKTCFIEAGAHIGFDPINDRKRFPFITENGIIVLPKGTRVPAQGPIEFASDIGELIFDDPSTKTALENVEVTPIISGHTRHSYRSVGPGTTRPPTGLPPQ